MEPVNRVAGIIAKIKKRPLIAAIDGGTSSGKSFFLRGLSEALKTRSVKHQVIEIDDYLISREARKSLGKGYTDLKKWFKLDELSANLGEIASGARAIRKPRYDHRTGLEHERTVLKITGDPVIIVNGIFSFDRRMRRFSNLNILVEADAGARLEREIERNLRDRGVPREETVKRFREVLDPTYEKHIRETRKFADIVIDNNDWKKPRIAFLRKKLEKER